MASDEEEHIYTIPLRKTWSLPRPKRSPYALREIRRYIARHKKVEEKNVWIDPPVNESIWRRGIENPLRRIRVRAVKFEDDLVEVTLPEE